MDNKCKEAITMAQINEIKKILLQSNKTKNEMIKINKGIIQVSTLEYQKYLENSEVSSIDLGYCEILLKYNYSISQDESLLIFKLDIKTEDLLSTYVYYEIYDPTGTIQLDLDICKNVEIVINSPVILDNTLELISNSLNEFGYNLFDGNDSFYKDICAIYTTINGTDILLSDRKNDLYRSSQNQTMCQTGCKIKSYNSTNKKAICNCSINQEELKDLSVEDLFDKNVIAKSFYNTLSNSNFRVLKCYKLVISSKFLKNIGGILMSILLISLIILTIISCIKGSEKINYYINLILKKKIIKKDIEHPETNMQSDKNSNAKKKISNKIKNRNKNKKINSKRKIERNKKDFKDKVILGPPKKRKKSKNNTKKNVSDNSKDVCSNYLSLKNTKNNEKYKINEKKNKKNTNKIKNKEKSEVVIYKNDKIKKIKKNKKKNIDTYNLNSKKDQNSKNKLIPSLTFEKNNNNEINSLNDQELNSLEYKLAIELDKRTYFQYYWSLLKKKHLILFSFLPSNDYNVVTIKISLFILSFALYFTINGFFFSDDTMHKIYKDNGAFDILFQIPQILYSTVISAVINMILKTLSLSEKSILSIKEEKDAVKAVEKSKKTAKCVKFKFALFFILSTLFMFFFWYFISCFCAVYVNTQIILLKDTMISFGLSMIYPFGLNLLPGFFRIPALRAENKDKECLYKISTLIALI